MKALAKLFMNAKLLAMRAIATSTPLVSCIMPTANRRSFVPWAIADFLRQNYPSRELIVVDDGADSVADLIPDDDRIVYIRLDRRERIGTKRNLACDCARGDVIAHWDDDDWHAPNRLSVQVAALTNASAGIVGTRAPLYYEPTTGRAWRYVYRGTRPWFAGNSLCYRREVWRSLRFEAIDVGEDALFVAAAARSGTAAIDDDRIHVGIIHASNVSPKRTALPSWRTVAPEEIAAILGPDMARFSTTPTTRWRAGGSPPGG